MNLWMLPRVQLAFWAEKHITTGTEFLVNQLLWLQEEEFQFVCDQTMYPTTICIIPEELLVVGHLQQLPSAHHNPQADCYMR